MRRRDFLKSCTVAAAGMHIVGCTKQQSDLQPSGSPGTMPAAKDVNNPEPWVDMTFIGLCLFAIKGKKDDTQQLRQGPLDVLLVKPEKTILGAHEDPLPKHFGTLTIPRWAIANTSSVPAAAADENFVYFSLEGKNVDVVPQGGTKAPLTYRYAPLNADQCGKTDWGNLAWAVDLSELWGNKANPGADWPSNWPQMDLFATIHLAYGNLENGQGNDGEDHYRYELPMGSKNVRLAKQKIRLRIQSPLVDFRIGNDVVTVNTDAAPPKGGKAAIRVSVSHVPSYWVSNSPGMRDFKAFGSLLSMTPTETAALSIPSHQLTCADPPKSTGGCECCPNPTVFYS